MRKLVTLGLTVCFLLAAIPDAAFAGAAHSPEALSDDCHAEFSFYLGAQPYILNSAFPERSRTTIIAMFDHPAGLETGAVPFRLEVRSVATGKVVYTADSGGNFVPGSMLESVMQWDGRDRLGRNVPDGEYKITALGELRPGERWTPARRIDDTERPEGRNHIARGSSVNVIVDRAGKYDNVVAAKSKRRGNESHRAPIDSTFPYNYFTGTTHAHTNWSDGGMPVSACQSGTYGAAGGAQPADAFSYAKANGDIDYLAVVEHNHLMQEACSTCSSQGVMDRYTAGFQAAQTATVPGSFVGLFGMEWGVISGGGHINIYNQSKLMSWTGEPFHVMVNKSVYSELYTAMKNNQGTSGSYGTFNHPNTSDFNSWARTADGDAVMRGLSIISGPAFNTSTSFAPGGSTYESLYNHALARGWKIGPEAHQDNHCWNYGNATPNRTVALIPTGTTFDQASLMAAYNARRFFTAQDRDAQLVYKTSDGTRVMGASFTSAAGVSVAVSALDGGGEGVQKIEIWGGLAGTSSAAGPVPTIVASNTSSTSLAATLAPRANGETWYYYVKAVQADGNIIWSSPMWITWSSSCTVPGAATQSSPAASATGVATSTTLSWTAASGATSYDVYFGTASSPAFYQSTAGTSSTVSGLANSTVYYWRVVPTNSCGAGATTSTRSFTTVAGTCTLPGVSVLSSPAAGATGVSTSPTLSWGAVTGATSYDVYFGTTSTPAFVSNVTTTSLARTGLAANTTHYWTVAAKSSCGAGAQAATRSFVTAAVVSPTTIFNEGAESGAIGWTFTKNTGSGWSIETTTDSRSGAKRFKTNVGYTTYLDNASWAVVSPAFSLSGKTSATLTYYNKYKTESGYDFLTTQISTDGGVTWVQLRKVSGQSTSYPSWAAQVSHSLTSYVGQANCKIRFLFTSDTTVTDYGVALDDIVVTAQ